MRGAGLLLAGIGVVSGACKTMQTADVDPGSVPLIVGGRELAAESPGRRSAVMLLAGGDFRCSGVLVAPDLVATAAHCLMNEPADSFSVVFGDSLKEPTAVLRVTEARQYRPWNAANSAHFDIAWLRLEEAAPKGYEPVEILTDATRLKPGTPLLLVGYGRTSSDASDYGSRLEVDSLVNRHLNDRAWRNIFVTGPTPGRGTCQGDSGGPAYVRLDGRWYLTGTNFGTPPELFNSVRCEDGQNVETFVGRYKGWVEATARVRLPGRGPKPLEPRDAVTGRGFLAWCQATSLSDEAWYTVMQVTRALGADDCVAAAASLDKLETLDLGLRAIRDLRPLGGLTNLRRLILAYNDIDNLEPLVGMRSLTLLNVRSNRIQKLEALTAMPGLVDLVIHDNLVSDLTPLARLAGLSRLYAGCNRIADTRPLAALRFLTAVDLPRNQLRDLRALTPMTWLELLNVQYNPLRDAESLRRLGARETLTLLSEAEGDAPGCGDGGWPMPPDLE